MEKSEILTILENYKTDLNNIILRFQESTSGIHIDSEDQYKLKTVVIEVSDFLNDLLGTNNYSHNIIKEFNEGTSNLFRSPSFFSVKNIIAILESAITRITRNEKVLLNYSQKELNITRENIFIIHGHDEAKWRELKEILKDRLNLNPIILSEQTSLGSSTLIEKFERYANTCSFAFALFTPDDVINKDGREYLQARPNVLFELGWFCSRLGRENVILILKEGTSIFSDFDGVIQRRFKENISELEEEIKKELISVGILPKV